MHAGLQTGPALLADIGGTNARLALLIDGEISDIRVEQTGARNTLAETLVDYLSDREVDAAALAVAGPVDCDPIVFTNAEWSFRRADIAAALGLENVLVINDFAAQALALPSLSVPADLTGIGSGQAVGGRPKAVLGPGTGFGVAALLPHGDGWQPLTTEAGHMTLPAMTPEEDAIIDLLRREFGHVSAERVLSGPGLTLLHRALARLHGENAADATPEEITAAALAGSDSLAVRTLETFCRFLGTVAADAALAYGAAGGVYIAGGIVPRLGSTFATSGFRERFETKGRFSAMLCAIPTFVITANYPAFRGLKALVETSDQAS